MVDTVSWLMRPAAQRPRAVRRVDQAGVRQLQELPVQRVEQQVAQVGGRPSERGAQVGAADVADEQGVAGQDGHGRVGTDRRIEHQQRDRLRRVPGRLEGAQADRPQPHFVAVAKRGEGVLGRRLRTEIDRRAHPIAQFQVPGHEIGVQVRQQHVPDSQAVLRGELEVLIDVPLRIDHGGHARRLVADEVRGVAPGILR